MSMLHATGCRTFPMRRVSPMAAVLCAMLALQCNASAQGYPTKLIHFIVPQSPGSATDTVARMIAQKLSERMGQQVVVDNRAGAGGIIGAELAAKAAPDGYTIVIVSATHAVNPSLRHSLPFDPVRSFTPVTLATSQPYVLVAHPSLPARTVKELVALARAHPGQINYASSAAGSLGHLGLEQLKSMAHIDMVHVPYKGVIPALTDVMGGHVSLMFLTLVSGMPQVKAGKLRALAVSAAKRSPAAPEVPTVAESGFPDFDVRGWYAILAPANTPAAVVNRLNAEIVVILHTSEVRERLAADGSEAVGSTPEQLDRHLKAEIAKWARVIKAAGIKAD